MRGFSENWKAIRSFFENAAPRRRRGPIFRHRKAIFEALSPREMLSASSGRMIAAHSLAISASLHAGQPAMVSACSHSSSTGSSAATLAVSHLANGARNNGAALFHLGTGAVTLSGATNYHGGTTMVTAGTLTLTGTNTFTGSTTINAGTLAINGGGVLINGGTLRVPPNAGATSLTGGTTLWQSGTGTLELAGNPTLGNYNTVSANAGTLRFNNNSCATSVGTGVPVNVTGGGTLELAGTVSDLSTSVPPDRVHTIDLSNVTGTNQPIGAIDGTGDTVINSGATLTANHIVQGALTIGGDAGTPAPVTIAASDFSGSPLATSLLATGIPIESSTLGSPSLISTVGSDSSAV
jgi:fibronectin-binding autotransporter adhesin